MSENGKLILPPGIEPGKNMLDEATAAILKYHWSQIVGHDIALAFLLNKMGFKANDVLTWKQEQIEAHTNAKPTNQEDN